MVIVGGDEVNGSCAAGRADGVDVTLLSCSDRTGVLRILSSSSIVLCR